MDTVRRWEHRNKGPITGVEVGGDETWIKVRLVGEHEIRWLSPGRHLDGPVSDGEIMTLRRSFLTEVS